jgi:hypothetical protein
VALGYDDLLEGVADTPDEVRRAVDQLLHRGGIEADEAGRLRSGSCGG